MQCDQMARLFFKYLAICNNKIWPNCIKHLPKYVEHFAKFSNVAKDFEHFAKSGHTYEQSQIGKAKVVQ